MILRPYQDEAVLSALSALEAQGNTVIVAPTGAGKTIMMAALGRAVAERHPGLRTLVVQHRDELLFQNARKWELITGAGASIFNATTKSIEAPAIFGMVQTLARNSNLDMIPAVDLLIIDEAHHVAAESYLKIIAACRAKNPRCMVVGFTATASRGDGKGLGVVFTNCSFQITIHELIRLGFLVPPAAYVMADKEIEDGLSHVRKLASDYDMEEVAKVMNIPSLNVQIVQRWKERASTRSTLVFCSTVLHAMNVLAAFKAAGVSAEMVTGETPKKEREETLSRLKRGKTMVVVNVAVLTEGFDSPRVSAIVLLRPCSQKTTLIQMVGRGIRPAPQEEFPGLVKTDCLILDFGTSIKEHGNIVSDVDLSLPEERLPGEAPTKHCPSEEVIKSVYRLPDKNDRYGCGMEVPASSRECPFCGFVFERVGKKESDAQVRLREVDLLNQSPFRWVDIFGDDPIWAEKVMVASGFGTFVVVTTGDGGETWVAFGKEKAEILEPERPGENEGDPPIPAKLKKKKLKKLFVGARLQAIAFADDFLRNNEDSKSIMGKKKWMHIRASEKQLDTLQEYGYSKAIYSEKKGFTKLIAGAHICFRGNERLITRALGLNKEE